MKKRVEPKVSNNFSEIDISKIDFSNNIDNLLIKDKDIDKDIRDIEFNGCKFINVNFMGKIEMCDFIDCIFINCSFNSLDFSNRSIHRVSFKHCNLSGSNFIVSSIRDVIIYDCKGDYVNISDSKIERLEIVLSLFKESRFINNSFKDIVFDKVNFKGSEFLSNKLEGIDFSSCNISEISISSYDVKGMIVNDEQALMLISLFGIVVKSKYDY